LRQRFRVSKGIEDMWWFARLPLLATLGWLSISTAFANDTRRDVVEACARDRVQQMQLSQKRERPLAVRGSVTCPAADVVGFPPRVRRHDRQSILAIPDEGQWTRCPGTDPHIRELSNVRGRIAQLPEESGYIVKYRISCTGARLGEGRAWMEAEISVEACPIVTAEKHVQAVIECATPFFDSTPD
jgi:hypothetical protein